MRISGADIDENPSQRFRKVIIVISIIYSYTVLTILTADVCFIPIFFILRIPGLNFCHLIFFLHSLRRTLWQILIILIHCSTHFHDNLILGVR
jgi:hypothetical protein